MLKLETLLVGSVRPPGPREAEVGNDDVGDDGTEKKEKEKSRKICEFEHELRGDGGDLVGTGLLQLEAGPGERVGLALEAVEWI